MPDGGSRRGLIWALGILAGVLALAIIGLVVLRDSGEDVTGPESAISSEEATEPLEGATPELAAIRADANTIIGGGAAAFEGRLAELEGTPVVVNRWASWCGPCRFEFPMFQEVALDRGDEVAFVGLNTKDVTAAGERFLAEMPLPYPSYSDPDGKLAESVHADYAPSTTFLGLNGEIVYTHLGPYESAGDLEADIDRYAG